MLAARREFLYRTGAAVWGDAPFLSAVLLPLEPQELSSL
jgi:hypothetical protein